MMPTWLTMTWAGAPRWRTIVPDYIDGAAIELVYPCVYEPGDLADYAAPDEEGIIWRTGTRS
jgi:hypothetical protein